MDDAEAVRECRGGHMEAFQHLVRRYQGRALAHGRALTGNEADAADAAQEAFVDAFRHLKQFDVRREFYPWLYVLLRNRCFKQRTRPGTRPESAPLADRAAMPGPPAEQALDLRAALATLREAWMTWQELEAPYHAARVRVLMGLACRALGDDDAAELELDAARQLFERMSAAPDVVRVNDLL